MNNDFIIKEDTLLEYNGMEMGIVIPEGITRIGKGNKSMVPY